MRFRPSILEVLIFIAGFVFGGLATEWLTVSGVKLAETVSALFTALGVLFAVYVAKSWLRTKEQDDKYLAAKRVFSALAAVWRDLEEYHLCISPIIPRPGSLVPSDQDVEDIIFGCRELKKRLEASARELHVSIDELSMHEVQIRRGNESFQQEVNEAGRKVHIAMSSLANDMRNYLGARQQRPGFDHSDFHGQDLLRHYGDFWNAFRPYHALTQERLQPIRKFFQL